MAVTLQHVKDYLRIDTDDEDEMLEIMLAAAKESLEQAGVPESEKALYKVAVFLHVSMHYENRNPEKKMDGYDQVFINIIPKLKDGL
ncbi:hypothetical protein J40TS1_34110 [Paenibacillus montaniterrae]|uniref:Phage gp6-like head-tail connector protein n=1 Tax=Paenibacillus montaniterrae TaxID=429341 RepID=A0A920D099_9BACL|nr:head-tail connector protein [Paenibacillus montaniterrae]GIP17769.1 hypothetical protein J40TS1_34110 [Paenibacillus montaniterrae]